MIFKQMIKAVGYRASYLMQYQSCLLNRIVSNAWIPILSLHRVSYDDNYFWPPLKPAVFNDLLKYLKKHFEIVTFHEIEHVICKKPKLVLSFDDGYYDFIEYAMPILKKNAVRVNQNIIPSQLLGEDPLWNIDLYDFLQAAPNSLIKEIRFINFDAKKFIKSKLDKLSLGLAIGQEIVKLTSTDREYVIAFLKNNFFDKLDFYPKTRMIKLSEMNNVILEHEVGAHSYSHNSMGNESMNFFIDDFKKCQDFFQNNNFPKLDIYSFPNGSYRQEQIDYLKQNEINHILLVDDEYATLSSPYHRLNIAAFNRYEAIFQSLGIKAKIKSRNNYVNCTNQKSNSP